MEYLSHDSRITCRLSDRVNLSNSAHLLLSFGASDWNVPQNRAHKWTNIAEKQIQPRSISKEKKTLTTTTAKILIRQRGTLTQHKSTCQTTVMSKRHINENGLRTKAHCFLSNYQTNLSFHIQIVCQHRMKATDLMNDSKSNETKRNETMRWRWAEQNRTEPNRTERRTIKKAFKCTISTRVEKRNQPKYNKLIRWTYLIRTHSRTHQNVHNERE